MFRKPVGPVWHFSVLTAHQIDRFESRWWVVGILEMVNLFLSAETGLNKLGVSWFPPVIKGGCWNTIRSYLSVSFCLVGGGIKVHSTLRPLNGLLCQHQVIMLMEKSVEWLAGETEVLGENLPQYRFVHHKPHTLPVREPGPPRWEASV
jgi:hypothetical protein